MRVWLLLLLVVLAGGCATEPVIPAEWSRRAVADGDVADGPSRLQVLIGYGKVANHIVLRVTDPAGSAVMWDPGGSYGDEPRIAGVVRRRDVVTRGVPDLRTYADYRYGLRSRADALAVLEWYLPPSLSRALVERLRGAARGEDIDFDTDVGRTECGTAACAFLQRFVPALDVPKRWLLPSDLADHLLAASPPRRVLYFVKGESGGVVFTPPASAAAAAP